MTPRLKGVVFDIDGTLLTSDHRVSSRMKTVCGVLSRRGTWLSVASARPPRSVRLIAESIGAHGPLCALNGAVIMGRDGSLHQRRSLPDSVARGLAARFAQDSRVSLNIYSGADWLVPRVDTRIRSEASIIGFDPTIVQVLEEITEVEKLLLICDEDYAIRLTRILSEENGGIVVARSNPGYVEITPSGVDKAVAIEEAARAAGLSMKELVACGDGENDVQLISRAGYGIAMGHAPAALRSVASKVVGSNDDDSLAMALIAIFSEQTKARI